MFASVSVAGGVIVAGDLATMFQSYSMQFRSSSEAFVVEVVVAIVAVVVATSFVALTIFALFPNVVHERIAFLVAFSVVLI